MNSMIQCPAPVERTNHFEHLEAGKNYALAHEGMLL
jgi:hypothetical protein